jgi:hypothetical protein
MWQLHCMLPVLVQLVTPFLSYFGRSQASCNALLTCYYNCCFIACVNDRCCKRTLSRTETSIGGTEQASCKSLLMLPQDAAVPGIIPFLLLQAHLEPH